MSWGTNRSTLRLTWSLVATAVVVTVLTILLVWRLDRVERRASALNQTYLPIIRSLNVIQGKWQGYQRTFEQSVGFRRWGTPEKIQPTPGRGGVQRVFETDFSELERLITAASSNANNTSSSEEVIEHAAQWLKNFRAIAQLEVEFFNNLAERLKTKNYTSAALLYSNFRSKLSQVFNEDWSDLSHRIDLVTQQNQHLIETELGVSQNIVLFFLIGALLFSLNVLLKINRWVVPVLEWTRVAREIALGGDHDIKYPPVRSNMPEEMQVLTREFKRMATTLVEREKTIQEQKKKLEALVETERKLAHAKKLLLAANMSSQVAHEVRNPLNSMGLQLEMLKEDVESGVSSDVSLQSNLTKRIDTVAQQVQRLERITDRYLDLSTVRESSKNYRSVNLHELIESCLEFMAQELQVRGIRVELNLQATEPNAQGDRDGLAQVIFNLIKNAIEAHVNARPGDGEKVQNRDLWIRISSRNVARSVVINVEDNGPGVKSNLGAQVFEPFVTTKAQGHGLGLSVSRQICLDHGGDLELLNSREGASFDMRVPCAY